MGVPVLIPARNEARHIAATLKALPEEAEAYVIPNRCSDNTEEIARDFGAEIIAGAPGGKLPALQHAIRQLGERATEPFVSLDGDTRPLFPDQWLNALLEARDKLDPERPALITGPFVDEGLDPVTLARKNALRRFRAFRHYRDPAFAMSGTNMLFDLQNAAVVQGILELPPVWPFEDKALRDEVVKQGGQVANTINRQARVVSDGADRHVGFLSKLKLALTLDPLPPPEAAHLAEAPPGSVSYHEFKSAAA